MLLLLASPAPAASLLALASRLPTTDPASSLLDPNVALLASVCGVLLLFLECNRPGHVLPGATGLLLLLLGTHVLAGLPLRLSAILLLALACCALALPLQLAVGWDTVLAGSALLATALATLSRRPGLLSAPLAITCGLVLGPISGWLAIVAGNARRAKYRLRTEVRSDGGDTRPEHWE